MNKGTSCNQAFLKDEGCRQLLIAAQCPQLTMAAKSVRKRHQLKQLAKKQESLQFTVHTQLIITSSTHVSTQFIPLEHPVETH